MLKRIVGGLVLMTALATAGCEVPEEETGSQESSGSKKSKKAGGFEAKGDYHPHMGVGKTVKVDGVRYRILSAETTKTIGDDEFDFAKETADGRFLILRISAANDRKKSSSLSDDVMAIEANGNTYSPDSEGTFAFLVSRGGDQNEDPFFLRDIQPGNTTKGFVVFDLPASVANKAKLSVRFNELGFGSDYGYLMIPPR
jgi:uncharacterized protein DUF4352